MLESAYAWFSGKSGGREHTAAVDFRAVYAEVWQPLGDALERNGVPSRDLPDVRQEVLIALARRLLGEGPPVDNVIGLGVGIAHARAVDYHRARKRRRENLGMNMEERGPPVAPPDQAEEDEQRCEDLLRVLGELPQDDRDLLWLYDVDNLPSAKLAAIYACSENALRLRVGRVRASLKKALERMTSRRELGGTE